jgi:hypothetical protein
MLLLCAAVQYKLREDPRLLRSGEIPSQGDCRVSLSPDARIAAVAVNSSIFMYSTASGDLMETLDSVHRGNVAGLNMGLQEWEVTLSDQKLV